MPLPFAIPPRWHVFPSISNSTAHSFLTVSVVIIALAASVLPSGESPFTSLSMLFSNGSICIGIPITPVEATITSSGWIPSTSASRILVFSAISSPLGLHVLAFLELAITALDIPLLFFRCFCVTIIGAPFTLFLV